MLELLGLETQLCTKNSLSQDNADNDGLILTPTTIFYPSCFLLSKSAFKLSLSIRILMEIIRTGQKKKKRTEETISNGILAAFLCKMNMFWIQIWDSNCCEDKLLTHKKNKYLLIELLHQHY